MKRLIAKLIIITALNFNYLNVYAITDNNILKDEVSQVYSGTKEAQAIINNIKFNDVASNYWAKEAITKAGALNLVKGYSNNYNPKSAVSNQEALAFLIRVAGLENTAQELGESLKDTGFGDSTLEIWSLGYLTLARNMGLITVDEYNSSIQEDLTNLEEGAFNRTSPVTREQVATWTVQILNSILEEPLEVTNQQKIYNFSDWTSISSEHINNVEICIDNGIMQGSDGKFNPKGSLTRAEMAQLLINMDSIYNKANGLEAKRGTVAAIKDEQSTQSGNSNLIRNIYIRTNDGSVDIIQYEITAASSPQAYDKDVVVYNNGVVTGLASLKEGNDIEYLVRTESSEAIYVNVVSTSLNQETVFGLLSSIDYLNGQVTIIDSKNKSYTYYSVDGLVGTSEDTNFTYIDGIKKIGSDIPIGSYVNLKLNNNIITEINYVGGYNLVEEISGIVIENNPAYSYLTIMDSNGNEVTKNYYSNDIIVEKQEYYDTDDEIGYINQMFPNFTYDPRSSTIDKVEVGDIVTIRTKEDDSSVIESISAVTNYTVKYATIKQISNNGNLVQILVEYDNGETTWFEFNDSIFISKGGSAVSISTLAAGDYVKLLVNSATISSGYIIESIKEIVIEEQGHLIGDIIKGELGSINTLQNKVSIQNAYTLTKDGWTDYKDVLQLSIANNDIEYYYENSKVSLDYFNQYLKRGSGEVYIALENSYSGDVISKITYRNSRDELLDSDLVTNTNGVGTISIPSYSSNITIDDGTIIRKNGRIISANSIDIYDYARISLNSSGKAAIIDIYDEPITSGVLVARGRVTSIDENKSFTVSSISLLSGNSWIYSPVEREFSIDANTYFITSEGIKRISEFIGYSDESSIGQVFTIIYDGTKATHIIESPYANKVMSGTVYSVDIDNSEVSVKNGSYFNSSSIWTSISNVNSAFTIDIETNTIVIKNNKVTDITALETGDNIRVFTEILPSEITGGVSVTGRIIFVDN